MTIFQVGDYEVSTLAAATRTGEQPWRGEYSIFKVDGETRTLVARKPLHTGHAEMLDAIAEADAEARAHVAGLKPERISWGKEGETAE